MSTNRFILTYNCQKAYSKNKDKSYCWQSCHTLIQSVCSVLHIVYLLQKQLKKNANKTTGTVATIGQLTTPKKINKNTQVNVITYVFKFQQSSLNTTNKLRKIGVERQYYW